MANYQTREPPISSPSTHRDPDEQAAAHDGARRLDPGLRFLEVARARPDLVAVREGARCVTYGQLAAQAAALALQIRGARAEPGLVAAVAEQSLHAVLALVATALAGAGCQLLSAAMWRKDLREACSGKLVLTEGKLAATFGEASVLRLDHAPSGSADDTSRPPDWLVGASVQETIILSGAKKLTRGELSAWLDSVSSLGLPSEHVLQLSDPASLAFALQTWTALANGGSLELARADAPALQTLTRIDPLAEAQAQGTWILAVSACNELLARDPRALDKARALLLLGSGLDAAHEGVLGAYAGRAPALLYLEGLSGQAGFVGRLEKQDGNASLTALGRPLVTLASDPIALSGGHGPARSGGLWRVFALDDVSRAKQFWHSQLAGIPPCIDLGSERARLPSQRYQPAQEELEISSALAAQVDALALRCEAAADIVLLAALAVVLQRRSASSEVVLGTALAGEHHALPLRLSAAGCRSFSAFTRRVQAILLGARQHPLAFEGLLDLLQPELDPSHHPVYQVMFRTAAQAPDAHRLRSVSSLDSSAPQCDLTFEVGGVSTNTQLTVHFDASYLDAATVRRLAGEYLTFLRHAVEEPDAELTELPWLPDEERRLVLETWARGPAGAGQFTVVTERVAEQARLKPDAPALVDANQSFSYAQLERATDALAARLQRLGVRSGSVVGVYLDRSAQTVIALLGIMKAGAAYLPLDPTYPKERLALMVADSDAAVIVSRVALLPEAGRLGASVLAVDQDTASPAVLSLPELSEQSLAYLIYTSGSTGRPKGVKVTHGNLVTFLAAMDDCFGGDGAGTWLAVTSISFDISVLELLWTLTRGFRVVVQGEQTAPAAATSLSLRAPAHPAVELSLFFFGNAPAAEPEAVDPYRMLFDAAAFADEHDFRAIWTPERHFHSFGGLYPSPSVLAAALAAHTKRIGIRAGSVVLPLHDPLRVAEEWALLDNLSHGRIGISFASGWQPDDFVLAADSYADRKAKMLTALEEVRSLWRGGRLRRRNGKGVETEVAVYPRPVQKELPVWLTSAQQPETFRVAGEVGAGILTHLIGHTLEQLADKIKIYRDAFRKAGHPGEGHVTLMMHTYVGADLDEVKRTVRKPLKDYIATSYDLMSGLGRALKVDMNGLPPEELEQLLEHGFERFFESSGLLGTVDTVSTQIARVEAIGVDEVGCLIDFGVSDEQALQALRHLVDARSAYLRQRAERNVDEVPDLSIAAQVARFEVTHLQCTPSLASSLLAEDSSRQALRSLRRLLVGGEALPPELAAELAEAVGGSVHNMYGPTEATVWATSSAVERGRPPMIGRPLAGYAAYVVDGALRPVAIGVPGELLLAGAAVAAGYHGRPELTDEKFLPDHLSGERGGRLYRTGDLVRWRTSGELEFLGRIDQQVKLRGRRIELGEIEAALDSLPAIQRAVCALRGEGGAKRIVADCVTHGDAELPLEAELRAELGRTLPEFMHPTSFVRLAAFPLTPNGKIDRKALPDPLHPSQLPSDHQAPVGALEQTIAAVWSEVLRNERIGRHDNFFSIGGNSVLVVAARGRLLEKVDGALSLVDMFRSPTIASLAATISARALPKPAASSVAARAAEAAQRRRGVGARNRIRLEGTEKME
ncbi:MAG: Natural product biosynthesis luciferase-like monooxygenase protein [Myxococcaceae bacterium]|nr:Natural product biosynthesis luciferase-like monooxygenase protein [Myxococcaceae bacterium]